MRPQSITVTSSNSPYYMLADWRGGELGVTATPNSGNYDVAYTHEPADGGLANITTWTDITDMSAATAAASKEIGPCVALRITLNSGTSVKVDVTQRASN